MNVNKPFSFLCFFMFLAIVIFDIAI